MKKTLILFGIACALLGKAQTFNGTGGPILDNGVDTYFPLNISGLTPANLDSTFGVEQVCFTISHPAVSELYIYLQSPSGTLVNLTLGSSSSGADFNSTCVNSSNPASITLAGSPYNGTFKPVGYLGRFNTGQTGNGNWTLVVHDGFPNGITGTLTSWSLQFGNSPAHPVSFTSSPFPIVKITTTQPISDTKTAVSMGIIDNGSSRNNVTDPFNAYNNMADIHWHGSSTKNFEKKAYAFETKDATGAKLITSILGMPAESDWLLIASYIDKSLERIPMTYDLFRRMGHYAPRFRYVELMINNEYMGVYTFMEKIKRDSNRVHVQTMTTMSNSFPEVSGGYIFKIDRTDAPGWYSLLPGQSGAGTHFYYNYEYPNDVDITTQQKAYIKSYVDSFETVMNSPNYADPVNGYPKYIGVNTFVDYFIINELSKNIDAYRLSTYLYKKNISKGGQMYIGPVWDYDIAYHNCNYGNNTDPTGWQYQLQDDNYPVPTWWARFMQDTSFQQKLYCRWVELRQNLLSLATLNNYIDSSAAVLSEAQQRNFTQFPIMGAYIYPNPQNENGATYQTEVSDVKNWIAARISWMDGAITGTCSSGIASPGSTSNKICVFPNPMTTGTTFKIDLAENAEVTLRIHDLVGNEVGHHNKTLFSRGEHKINFEREQLPAGMYVYELRINDSLQTGKLVMQ